MKITILGAGNVGGALGEGWSRAGHTIIYGVPNPEDARHRQAAAKAGGAKMLAVSAAAASCDVLVLAVPWEAIPGALAACGDLAGRLVLDATNPLTFGPEGLALAVGFTTSGAEEVARLAPGARVIKAMNQVGFQVMAHAAGYPCPPVMFVAGDDVEAKAVGLTLVRDLGFEGIDAGPLARARLLEPLAMLWIDQVTGPNAAAPTNAFSFMRKP